MFVTAFTISRHLSLSWASPIQSIIPHPTSWKSIQILSSHLRLGLLSGLFTSGFPTKTVYTPLYSLSALHAPSISFFSILLPAQYWVRSTDHDAPHYEVFSTSCYLVPLRPKYFSQHPILKHPQCQRPSFTPIQNNKQNYSSVYFNL
jgi:hypothetical protein